MADKEEAVRANIEQAVKVEDILDGLIERVADDPGSAFEPEVLARLLDLKREDRAEFERIRAGLKNQKVRVSALDREMGNQGGGGGGGGGAKQADILVQLAEAAELFHAADSTGFADIRVGTHRETWPIRSKGFKRWLTRRFFEETGKAPNSEALQSALNVVEARAHFDAPVRRIHLRVASLGDCLFLDLADPDWRAVEIRPAGWQIVDEPPVRFRRAAGMQPLPVPTRDGSVDDLRSFLNVGSERDFVLVVAWALAVLRDKGPYPVLVLSGEQGSAKSTFAAIMRKLLDPNSAPLRALPREDRDLFIAANNGHLLTFDNISGLPGWISDTLCRLATGGGFAVRQLYTDQDEILFDAERPVILNGIEDFVARPDLADRSILLTLQPIPDENRRSERELGAAFEEARPKILGALLDAVAAGIHRLPETCLSNAPRMADFAEWATACEGVLWPPGSFLEAYAGNRDDAVDNVIESDPVASAVRAFATGRSRWTGTASQLLSDLAGVTGDAVKKARSWPQTPRALSNRLRRAATFLRKANIDITFDRTGHRRSRTITIVSRADDSEETSSAPSASSAPESQAAVSGQSEPGLGNNMRTMADATARIADDTGQSSVRMKPAEFLAADDADEADDEFPTQSAGWKTRV